MLIGDMCSVGLCRGVKSTYYDAKLLATGKPHKITNLFSTFTYV